MSHTVVIAHGRCEVEMVSAIKTKLRINIEIFSNDDGKKTISLNQIKQFLENAPFTSECELHKKYSGLEYSPKKKIPDLKIFPIIDVDEDRNLLGDYLDKKMFNECKLKEFVVPIYSDHDLDKVIEKITGREINTHKKPEIYRDLFYGMGSEDYLIFSEKLKKMENTNLSIFIQYCVNMSPGLQGKS